ncbi:putative eka-like protein [Erysiphe necator]|uniref:Putative eka-like protein n=1 Tax=Uncinula necator TaxID=52586 RepID=A0A0B1P3A8_UNCNE|nr:putative eka-like protein [Erysiphe necator]
MTNNPKNDTSVDKTMTEAAAVKKTANTGKNLHTSLHSIVAAMEQAENERKERLALAQEFLELIDTWAKAKEDTYAAALVVPFIQKIAPIVTSFATGITCSDQTAPTFCFENKKKITPAVPKTTNRSEGRRMDTTTQKLPKDTWAAVTSRATALPHPTIAHTHNNQVNQIETVQNREQKEDKRLFLRLDPNHEWRKLSPSTIKKVIIERAGVAASAIAAIYSVRSGLAIECVSDAPRESILGIGQTFLQNGAVIEAASD